MFRQILQFPNGDGCAMNLVYKSKSTANGCDFLYTPFPTLRYTDMKSCGMVMQLAGHSNSVKTIPRSMGSIGQGAPGLWIGFAR
jgi:hypothetical protein